VRLGKYAVPVLLLATLAIGTVAAVSYVILTWTMTLTVVANPRVHFYNESETPPADVANTMDIAMNIFPDVITIEEDAVWDIRSTGAGNIYIRVSTMDTNEVAKLKIIAYEDGELASPLFTEEWTGPTTDWIGATAHMTAAADYNLWIEVTGASTATPSPPTTTITLELKVETP